MATGGPGPAGACVVTHRDPKPDNVLLALGRVKVAYLALAGTRDLLKGTGLEEAALLACRRTNDLECALIKARVPAERKLPKAGRRT